MIGDFRCMDRYLDESEFESQLKAATEESLKTGDVLTGGEVLIVDSPCKNHHFQCDICIKFFLYFRKLTCIIQNLKPRSPYLHQVDEYLSVVEQDLVNEMVNAGLDGVPDEDLLNLLRSNGHDVVKAINAFFDGEAGDTSQAKEAGSGGATVGGADEYMRLIEKEGMDELRCLGIDGLSEMPDDRLLALYRANAHDVSVPVFPVRVLMSGGHGIDCFCFDRLTAPSMLFSILKREASAQRGQQMG